MSPKNLNEISQDSLDTREIEEFENLIKTRFKNSFIVSKMRLIF